MLKQGIKTISTEFIPTREIITTLFFPVHILCNVVSEASSHFDINVKK